MRFRCVEFFLTSRLQVEDILVWRWDGVTGASVLLQPLPREAVAVEKSDLLAVDVDISSTIKVRLSEIISRVWRFWNFVALYSVFPLIIKRNVNQ